MTYTYQLSSRRPRINLRRAASIIATGLLLLLILIG